ITPLRSCLQYWKRPLTPSQQMTASWQSSISPWTAFAYFSTSTSWRNTNHIHFRLIPPSTMATVLCETDNTLLIPTTPFPTSSITSPSFIIAKRLFSSTARQKQSRRTLLSLLQDHYQSSLFKKKPTCLERRLLPERRLMINQERH